MAVALLGAAGLGAVLASCVASTRVDLSSCDAVVTRCNTVCDTWCDDWGCYPDCYDSCWDDCIIDPNRAAPPPPATGAEAGAPPSGEAGTTDAASPAPPTSDGGGSLCTACQSNQECRPGALCVRRGGEAGDAGAGFCGQACTGSPSTSDCPAGFACVALGASLQCLPASGSCP
jgi:hypothetical protein